MSLIFSIYNTLHDNIILLKKKTFEFIDSDKPKGAHFFLRNTGPTCCAWCPEKITNKIGIKLVSVVENL